MTYTYACDTCSKTFDLHESPSSPVQVVLTRHGKNYECKNLHACSAACLRRLLLREADVDLDANGELIARLAETERLRVECDALRTLAASSEAQHRAHVQRTTADIAELKAEIERSTILSLRGKIRRVAEEVSDARAEYADVARNLLTRLRGVSR